MPKTQAQLEAEARALLAKGNQLGAQASAQTGVAFTPADSAQSNYVPPTAPVGSQERSQQLAQQAQALGVQNVPQSLLNPQPASNPVSAPQPTSQPIFTAPAASQPKPVQWLPQASSQGGGLTAFAAALDQATALAKQNRNALALGLMMPHQGTVAASDFNSILGNLNTASNQFSTNLVNRAMDAAMPRYETQQVGNQLVQMQYDNTGRFIGATPIANMPEELTYDYQTGSDGTLYEYTYAPTGQLTGINPVGQLPQQAQQEDYVYKSTYQDGAGKQWFVGIKSDGTQDNFPLQGAGTQTKPTQTNQLNTDRLDARRILDESKGTDGYVNTQVYIDLMNSWPGSPEQFIKEFPPSLYVNPSDPTVPAFIQDALSPY